MAKSPMPTDTHVGKMLRIRRVMLDMSQTDVANAVGVSFQQIQKYEKGTNRISASCLQQFARLLQVPVTFFFEGFSNSELPAKHAPSTAAPPDPIGFLATRDGLRLVKAYMQIRRRKGPRSGCPTR